MIRRILLLIVAFSFATCGSTSAQQPDQKSAKTSPIKIYFGQKIRMRDGVELSADVYRPDTDGRFPCILNRTPYLKNSAGSLKFGRYFAEHGYVFVAVDVRGRGDSPGNFVPYRHEGKDGYDSVEWCATQPWSTGKVGTIGGSYNGKTQWLTAVEHPPSDHDDRHGEPVRSFCRIPNRRADSSRCKLVLPHVRARFAERRMTRKCAVRSR